MNKIEEAVVDELEQEIERKDRMLALTMRFIKERRMKDDYLDTMYTFVNHVDEEYDESFISAKDYDELMYLLDDSN